MYPVIIEAMQSTLYKNTSGICVVDTHGRGEFRPDISVADFPDDRLLYCLWYFIELKLPGQNLLSPDNCGQVVDYFHKARERQPHRREFTGILSNFESAWVFTVCYESDTFTVSKQSAPTLADAIVYANSQSQLQYTKRIPPLDTCFKSKYSILGIGRHHFLLQVNLRSGESTLATENRSTIITRQTSHARTSTSNKDWLPPSRHRGITASTDFVLKIAHGRTTVANELSILRKIRDADCLNLPELVWAPEGGKQLGIVPVGQPIDFRQVASVSRKIVEGVIDGLEFLHLQGIIHRDIRPSNLVLDHKNNVIIIDYETSVVIPTAGTTVQYYGGFICWPKRLLVSKTTKYVPAPADDLHACILVILHLLFPSRFEAFHASSIGINAAGEWSEETKRLLSLWRDIEQSKIWGSFVIAAQNKNYLALKNMADVFCHP